MDGQRCPLQFLITNDEEIVRLLYNFYLRSREKKVENNNNNVAHYLGQMKDLYIELKWKIHIPLLSFLLPNDLIKIWKRGNEVRADFTFHDFKKKKNTIIIWNL